jgi:16S rRNA (uracil1498-N3)-methyltransferase
MAPRFFTSQALFDNATIELDPVAARHVQVLRLQPGKSISLFNGLGGEYSAQITDMGRSHVSVQVLAHQAIERELSASIHLQVGVPANERMDWLVEKATELGVASIQPLLTERTVLRLSGERADKRVAHWQAIAQAACEQSGRNRVPLIHPLQTWAQFLKNAHMASTASAPHQRWILSFSENAVELGQRTKSPFFSSDQPAASSALVHVLSGPEGGLSASEESAAIAATGYAPLSLGTRTLRAETAALAALIALSL